MLTSANTVFEQLREPEGPWHTSVHMAVTAPRGCDGVDLVEDGVAVVNGVVVVQEELASGGHGRAALKSAAVLCRAVI